MILLPVPTAEAINILNLPAELASNPVFEEHAALVLAQIEAIVDPDAYVLATTEGDEDPSPALQVAFRFGFAFLLLASVAEFLNLKTLGEGIVTTIGLDSSATQLLTGAEIQEFKKALTTRALKALDPHLNEEGLALLAASQTSPSGRVRVALI
jgi:hypothetical protein